MTDHDENQREAHKLLEGRIAEMREYLDFQGDDEEGPEDLGPIYDYGLEYSKAITNHRAETVTYVHVLSTGGPHEEFQVTYGLRDDSPDMVEGVKFVSLPWFGRVELEMSYNAEATAKEFYERFYPGEIL